jgi:O-antigen/teichoic acid export membrane protein
VSLAKRIARSRIGNAMMLDRFLGVFGMTSAGALLSFVAQLLTARWLGVKEYGYFSFVSSIALTIVLLAPLGFQAASLKYLAMYRVQGDWALFRSFLHRARRTTTVVSVVAACGLLVWAMEFGQRGAFAALSLSVLAAVMPFAAYSRLSVSVLRITGHARSAVGLDAPLREGAMAVMIFAAILLPLEASAERAVMTFAIGSGLSALLLMGRERCALRALNIPAAASAAPATTADWNRLAAVMLAMTFGQLAMKRLDVLLIGTIAGTDNVGPYAVALRFSEALQLPFVAGSVLVASRISELHALRDPAGLQRMVTAAVRTTLALTLLGALPLLVAPKFFLAFFGEDFAGADTMLRLLVIGQLANAATGYASGILTMTGNERVALAIVGLVGAANLAGNAVLITLFGPIGAAVGSSAAMIVANVTLWLLAWRRTGVNSAIR